MSSPCNWRPNRTSINRIPKKVDKDLVDEARALAAEVPVLTEKLRKAGLGSPFRMLKKVELALIAPPPAPKVEAVAPPKRIATTPASRSDNVSRTECKRCTSHC